MSMCGLPFTVPSSQMIISYDLIFFFKLEEDEPYLYTSTSSIYNAPLH